MKLCTLCSEPLEDQTTRARICDACKLEREIEKQELRDSRKQK